MKIGHYDNLPNSEYHSDSGSISKTQLDVLARDELGLLWQKNAPVDNEKLKTFGFGDAVHAITLEPHRLKQDFVKAPDVDLRTKIGKQKMADFNEMNEGKTILSHDDWHKLNMLYDSIMSHPKARKLIESPTSIKERSYFWVDPDTGVKCRCRPDIFDPELEDLSDLKTTEDLSKFSHSIEDFRYFVQDPFYCDGVNSFGHNIKRMTFIVVQKKIEIGRYPVQCIEIPDYARQYGRDTYKRQLERYAEIKETNVYQSIKTIEMSHNFKRKAGVL